MIKLAAVGLSAALGVVAMTHSQSADACPVREVIGPVGYYYPAHYWPYSVHERHWHPGYARFDRFHHRWDGR